MLKERVKYYYLDKDYNCAESILFATNDVYGLKIPEADLKLISGFGAGMGCGKTCGAICSALAIIGRSIVGERAHATKNFKDNCGKCVLEMEEELGAFNCNDIKIKNFKDDVRCFATVSTIADMLEKYLDEFGMKKVEIS